jgi:NAD(P)-dependent dehydrogenase (short-subunit alcohol dehydrogenase family)
MTFRGNVALITGAGSGMGQLAAWRLAAQGIQVAAVDIDEAGLERTCRRAPSIHPHPCDVADWEQVCEVVAKARNDLGPFDRVMTAAAIAPTGALLQQPVDEIRRLMDINYMGTVHVVKATLPGMLKRHSGDLVLFASLAGWLPSSRFGAYSATKFAVVAFGETLAHENAGSGVRFLCVCPPIVDTPLLEQVARGAEEMLAATPAIRPEVVLDTLEQDLERGRLFSFPGPGTRVLWWIRRVLPEMLWARVEQELAKHADAERAPAPAR